MSLIQCSECGKDVSDKANSCPNCGNPIAPLKEEYLCCPKCKSKELHSEQKGFSGGKALAGALVTGGIGLLAGTIGSKDVQITCLKCGNKFKAGEALLVSNVEKIDDSDKELKRIIEEKGKLSAVKYYKDLKGCDLASAKKYVDRFSEENNINPQSANSGGCASVILLFIIVGVSAICLLGL